MAYQPSLNDIENTGESSYRPSLSDLMPQNNGMVNTFLGKMPSHLAQFQAGTPENKGLIEDVINASPVSEMNVLGKPIGAGYNLLKKFVQKATANTKPLEQAADEAAKNASIAERQAKVPKTGSLISNPVTDLENVENEIGKHLNIEGNHRSRISQGITNRVNSAIDYWKDAYKNFHNDVSDANFQMPDTAMKKMNYESMSPVQLIKSLGPDAYDALKKGEIGKFIEKQKADDLKQVQGNNPYLKRLTDIAPTPSDNNAADFLAKYKDFRDRTFKLRQQWADPRTEEVEKQKMEEALNKAHGMQTQMKDVLDEGLGEFKPEFERVNKGYSEQVFPLRNNPVFRKAKEGAVSQNVMRDLETNESGMPLLRDMVKQDPELMRNVVGQRYKLKSKEVFSPDETMRSYLDKMPEFKDLVDKKVNLLDQTSNLKNISLAKKMDIEKQLQDIKNNRSNARKKIGYGAGAAAATAIGLPGIRYLSKILTNESNQ